MSLMSLKVLLQVAQVPFPKCSILRNCRSVSLMCLAGFISLPLDVTTARVKVAAHIEAGLRFDHMP